MGEKTLIIGGGLIGLTTAYELLQRGMDVHVIEAREEVALESSFANGGILVPSGSFPWNGPKVMQNLPSAFFDPTSQIKFHLSVLPSMLSWSYRFLRNSTAERHQRGMKANFQLASYSTNAMTGLRERLDIDYDAQTIGTMKVFRSRDELAEAEEMAETLAPLGLNYHLLDRDAVLDTEPHLADIIDQIVGGLKFPNDESGDAMVFCRQLSEEIQNLGGALTTNCSIHRIGVKGSKITGLETKDGVIDADRVIVCAGNWSPALVKPFGIRIAIKPVKGYSVTIDGSHLGPLPQMPIMDDAMHGNVVTLGTRLRLAGTAEFAGTNGSIDDAQIDHLFDMLSGLFPRIADNVDRSSATSWAGFRPVSADGCPYIGSTPISGLWINAGHGHVGWTMAAGSARLIADMVERRRPEIDPEPFRTVR